MGLDVKVTCDCCNKDITKTDSEPKYRLCLKAERMQHDTAFIGMVAPFNVIDRDYYFCDKDCLKKWLTKS